LWTGLGEVIIIIVIVVAVTSIEKEDKTVQLGYFRLLFIPHRADFANPRNIRRR